MTRALFGAGALLVFASLACSGSDSVPDAPLTATAGPASTLEASRELRFSCGGAGADLDACIVDNDALCRGALRDDDCDALRDLESRQTITPIHLLTRDFTGNGMTDMLVHAMPAGCGNCRSQVLILLENGRVLWDKDVYDAEVRIGPPWSPIGFWLKEPQTIEGEPGCCPSVYIETLYEWNGTEFSQAAPSQ